MATGSCFYAWQARRAPSSLWYPARVRTRCHHQRGCDPDWRLAWVVIQKKNFTLNFGFEKFKIWCLGLYQIQNGISSHLSSKNPRQIILFRIGSLDEGRILGGLVGAEIAGEGILGNLSLDRGCVPLVPLIFGAASDCTKTAKIAQIKI